MRLLKHLHLAFGIGGIFAFVLTGQYMAILLNGLNGMPDAPRLLYRTSHLYLMWSSLLNLIVGFYFANAAATKSARSMQVVSSLALLAGVPLLLVGFALEAKMNDLSRPFCGVANYLALGGTIVHIIASRNQSKQE